MSLTFLSFWWKTCLVYSITALRFCVTNLVFTITYYCLHIIHNLKKTLKCSTTFIGPINLFVSYSSDTAAPLITVKRFLCDKLQLATHISIWIDKIHIVQRNQIAIT